MKPRGSRGAKPNKTEEKMAELIDQLSEFQDWQATILPTLKADIKKGLSSKELRDKYAALVQARIISIAATAEKPGEALLAAKDILDRAHGKATEKKEVTHHLANASDKELDAILASEIQELDEMNGRFKPQ